MLSSANRSQPIQPPELRRRVAQQMQRGERESVVRAVRQQVNDMRAVVRAAPVAIRNAPEVRNAIEAARAVGPVPPEQIPNLAEAIANEATWKSKLTGGLKKIAKVAAACVLIILGEKFLEHGVFPLLESVSPAAVSVIPHYANYGLRRGQDIVFREEPLNISMPSSADPFTPSGGWDQWLGYSREPYEMLKEDVERQTRLVDHLKKAADRSSTPANIRAYQRAAKNLDQLKALEAFYDITAASRKENQSGAQTQASRRAQVVEVRKVGTNFPRTNERLMPVAIEKLPMAVTAARMAHLAYAPDFDRDVELEGYTPIYDYTRAPAPVQVGFVAYDKAARSIIVSFEGTVNAADISADLKSAFSETLTSIDRYASGGSRQIERIGLPLPLEAGWGFVQRLRNVSPELFRAIDDAVRRNKRAPIVVTGHSLGGALTTLTATVLKELYPDKKISFFAWETPRVFKKSTIRKIVRDPNMSTLDVDSVRTANPKDPVPNVPLPEMGYGHLGECWYFHEPEGLPIGAHSMEHIYNNLMNYIEDPLSSSVSVTQGRGCLKPSPKSHSECGGKNRHRIHRVSPFFYSRMRR